MLYLNSKHVNQSLKKFPINSSPSDIVLHDLALGPPSFLIPKWTITTLKYAKPSNFIASINIKISSI